MKRKEKIMAMQTDEIMSDKLIDELLVNTKTKENLFGKEGLLKNLTKRLMERLLEAEMPNHLGYMKHAIEGNNTGNRCAARKLKANARSLWKTVGADVFAEQKYKPTETVVESYMGPTRLQE